MKTILAIVCAAGLASCATPQFVSYDADGYYPAPPAVMVERDPSVVVVRRHMVGSHVVIDRSY